MIFSVRFEDGLDIDFAEFIVDVDDLGAPATEKAMERTVAFANAVTGAVWRWRRVERAEGDDRQHFVLELVI